MKFQPKTEEQVQAENLCPKGKQPFTVMECVEVTSKSEKNLGKEMLKLKLNIHADDGDYHAYDYIMDWSMAHKFRHFFFSIGLGGNYERGLVNAADCVNRQGWCTVDHKKANGQYPAKEMISDYLVVEPEKVATPATEASPVEEDDIPF